MLEVGDKVVYVGGSSIIAHQLSGAVVTIDEVLLSKNSVRFSHDGVRYTQLMKNMEKVTDHAPFVTQRLRHAADIFEQRAAIYGDNYKHFGKAMKGLFPRGLEINSEDDWNRLGILVQVMAKMTRYGQQFHSGGHEDSLDDASVYAMMLQELDADIKKRPSVNLSEIHDSIYNPVVKK